MSWSRWNGNEPARTTTYAYDDDGRVTAAVTTVEPEWDEDSRGLALALCEYEAGLCPGCRNPLAETTDPRHEDRYFTAEAVRCHRCTATDQASRRYEGSPSPAALLVPVEFRPPPPEPPSEEVDAWPIAR